MHPDDRWEVRQAGDKGRGVFARVPVAAGDEVLAMQGHLLPTHELTDDLMALQVGPDWWLCSDGSSLDDLVNHSCEPNLGFTHGTTVLYAIRPLAVGEELSFDYSTSLSEAGWQLECHCGAPTCRKIVRAWGDLTEAERTRLRPYALSYLRV